MKGIYRKLPANVTLVKDGVLSSCSKVRKLLPFPFHIVYELFTHATKQEGINIEKEEIHCFNS